MVDVLLRPGVSKAAANAALQPLLEQFANDQPKQFPEHFKVQVRRGDCLYRTSVARRACQSDDGVAL